MTELRFYDSQHAYLEVAEVGCHFTVSLKHRDEWMAFTINRKQAATLVAYLKHLLEVPS